MVLFNLFFHPPYLAQTNLAGGLIIFRKLVMIIMMILTRILERCYYKFIASFYRRYRMVVLVILVMLRLTAESFWGGNRVKSNIRNYY